MQEQLYNILSDSIEFCHTFEAKYYTFLKKAGFKKRIRKSRMELAEILTILIFYHFSGYANFKKYYKNFVLGELKNCFFLVSYSQFNKILCEIPCLLDVFLKSRFNLTSMYHFIDATCLPVCHIKRAKSNKVFSKAANKGYSTIHQHFFGFKLHLVVNHEGEIVNYAISKGSQHDVNYLVPLTKNLKGKLCGDKGYISEEARKKLARQNLKLLTPNKKNMKAKTIHQGSEAKMLQHRSIIESIFNKLKNVFRITSHKSRSVTGFFAHCLSTLLAYTFDSKKPSVALP